MRMRVRLVRGGRQKTLEQRRRAVVAVLLTSVFLSGCGDVHRARAASVTHDDAISLGVQMSLKRPTSAIDMIRSATGPGSEVLVANDDLDGNDPAVVVRLTAQTDGMFDGSPVTWVACWKYHLNDLVHPKEQPCPDRKPIVAPPAPPPPTLGPYAMKRLQATLDRFSPVQWSKESTVRRALALTFGGSRDANIEVTSYRGVTGVAVSAGRDCVMARSHPYEVWVPPRVLSQPSEAGCHADSAARGDLKQSPH